jgi:hypothetical protein
MNWWTIGLIFWGVFLAASFIGRAIIRRRREKKAELMKRLNLYSNLLQ